MQVIMPFAAVHGVQQTKIIAEQQQQPELPEPLNAEPVEAAGLSTWELLSVYFSELKKKIYLFYVWNNLHFTKHWSESLFSADSSKRILNQSESLLKYEAGGLDPTISTNDVNEVNHVNKVNKVNNWLTFFSGVQIHQITIWLRRSKLKCLFFNFKFQDASSGNYKPVKSMNIYKLLLKIIDIHLLKFIKINWNLINTPTIVPLFCRSWKEQKLEEQQAGCSVARNSEEASRREVNLARNKIVNVAQQKKSIFLEINAN